MQIIESGASMETNRGSNMFSTKSEASQLHLAFTFYDTTLQDGGWNVCIDGLDQILVSSWLSV